MQNRRQILTKRPVGLPDAATWTLKTEEVPALEPGQVLIKNEYVSLDPAMRGWMNDTRSYIPPVALGDVMRAGTIGTVVDANDHPKYKVGDTLTGWAGVEEYTVTDGTGFHQVDPSLAPLPTYLGTLGMPGMTAYFGIMEVGKLQAGDIVVVSGAAGAVGSVVGQLVKAKGGTAIGIAGGPEKCKYVVETLGFDACIDYKNDDVAAGLKEHCPKGMDIYFDNVGGEILDHCLARLRMHARVVICGAISQYNNKTAVQGPKNYLSLLVNRATMQGMVVMDYAGKYREAAMEMGGLMMQGKLKSREDVYEGIENFHETFLRLFNGEKRGKLVLKVG